ncbi:DUF4136 domain-containing protein [Spirosoma areae]
MKTTLLTLFVCLVALSAKCQINVDYDHTVDFGQYKTFAFAPGKAMRQLGVKDNDSTFINKNIQETVTQILSKKGLSFANNNADITITFIAGAKEKKEIENYIGSPQFGFGYGQQFYGAGGWWGPSWNNWWVNQYEQGTLILDIYDTKTNELVWRAYAVSNITNFNEQKFVDREVNRALKRFPPRKEPGEYAEK